MKTEVVYNLSPDDVARLIRSALNLPASVRIEFGLEEHGDDRFGSSYKLFSGATVRTNLQEAIDAAAAVKTIVLGGK